MTNQATLDYYRRREEQERELASRTTLPSARRIHLDLADRYAHIGGDSAQSETLRIVPQA